MTKKFFTFVLLTAAMFSMVSCIGDENDEPAVEATIPQAILGTWRVTEAETMNLGSGGTLTPETVYDETITLAAPNKIVHKRKLANGKTETTTLYANTVNEQGYGTSVVAMSKDYKSTMTITVLNGFGNSAHAIETLGTTKGRSLTLEKE